VSRLEKLAAKAAAFFSSKESGLFSRASMTASLSLSLSLLIRRHKEGDETEKGAA